MGKNIGGWGITAICGAVLGRQESAKKMRRRRLVLLVCALVVVLGTVFPAMAITRKEQMAKCEEALAAGGCVVIIVTIFLAEDYSSTPPPPGAGFLDITSPVSGNDHTCALQTFSDQVLPWTFGEIYYNVTSEKYYYNPVGKRWIPYGGVGGSKTTEGRLNQWKSAADYAPTLYLWSSVDIDPTHLYPNGCSDLPSQQPNQIPNSDTGKPGCNDQVL